MLIDNELAFNHVEKFTAAAPTSRVIDIMKEGEAIPSPHLQVSVNALPTSGAQTIGFTLQTSSTPTFTTPKTLVTVPAMTSRLGYLFNGRIPYGIERYNRIVYSGTATDITVSASLLAATPIAPRT